MYHDHDFFATLHDIYVNALMLQLFDENLTLLFLNGRHLCYTVLYRQWQQTIKLVETSWGALYFKSVSQHHYLLEAFIFNPHRNTWQSQDEQPLNSTNQNRLKQVFHKYHCVNIAKHNLSVIIMWIMTVRKYREVHDVKPSRSLNTKTLIHIYYLLSHCDSLERKTVISIHLLPFTLAL